MPNKYFGTCIIDYIKLALLLILLYYLIASYDCCILSLCSPSVRSNAFSKRGHLRLIAV